jgi:hypothetical protein
MKRIRQLIDGEEVIHYDGAPSQQNLDYALCGTNLEEDSKVGQSYGKPTSKPVTCRLCIEIVAHVTGKASQP